MTNFKGLRISISAEIDLKKIADYTYKHWGKLQKQSYLNFFKQSFLSLSQKASNDNLLPIPRARNEIDAGLLSYPIKKHVVYYRESELNIVVIRVLHSRMDPEKHVQE